MKQNSKYLIIVNPNAGKHQAKANWPEISTLLKAENIDYEVIFTQYRHHAIKLVKNNIEQKGYINIIVVGGDGTINEVVNGIFKQEVFAPAEITLSAITIGTGNDWAKMFDIPKDYASAIKTIKNGHTYKQDVGKVYFHVGQSKKCRYFINAAGLGFDALVTDTTNRQKENGKSSTFSYFSNMLKSLYKYKAMEVRIKAGKREIHNGMLFTLSLAIGKYTGGGMQQTPNAISNDGLFDLMLVDKIAKTKLLRKVGKLFNGKIDHLKEVQSIQTNNLQIESDAKLMIEIDGENIGHGPLEFEIRQEALQIIIP